MSKTYTEEEVQELLLAQRQQLEAALPEKRAYPPVNERNPAINANIGAFNEAIDLCRAILQGQGKDGRG